VSSSRTDTLVEVLMPQMGVSVAEGTLTEWRKQPGDWIEADETIADVTTDKVDVEIPSPASGRVAELLIDPDETVSVGTPIATIDSAARAGEAHPDESQSEESAAASDDGTGDTSGASGPLPESRSPEASPAPPPPAGEAGEADRSGFYSPVVRRIADEHGVDLDQVQGTGIGGRVRKKDVLAAVAGNGHQRPLHTESPYRPDEPKVPEPEAPEPEAAPAAPVAADGGERREPMSTMRKAIARHMVESRHTAAHCTTIVEVDFSNVADARRELKEDMARRGVPLTYLAFVALATVEALREFPILNASVDGDEIVYHGDVNLGIAVALDQGLIVPVIEKAQRLSLEGMAAAIADVAERARTKKLEPDEVHGGTFTITNPGQFGAVLATPIINQPQVAILDLEAIVKRPVVTDGDAIAVRPMSFLPMSWDHRALDGATAARFLARVKERLESWEAK
jgi:2-oxoglutarate dehydrogenase dihydrolipoamide succinyltransferase (E2 component)